MEIKTFEGAIPDFFKDFTEPRTVSQHVCLSGQCATLCKSGAMQVMCHMVQKDSSAI